MPSATAAAVSARLRDVVATVGPGWPAGTGPAAVLDAAATRLAALSSGAVEAWRVAEAGWTGMAAAQAGTAVSTTVSAVDELVAELGRMSTATTRASDAVATARARLQEIIAEFESRAAALESELDGPEADRAVAAEGQRALDEANAVVDELRTELDGQAAGLGPPPAGPPPAGPPPATTAPAGFSLPALPGFGSGLDGGTAGGAGAGLAGTALPSAGRSGGDEARARPATPTPDAGVFGDGVSVSLPDGTTATAPNDIAAKAVRNALTQIGVPYDWGGTTPGVGFDCSGLTQWAYSEAGLNLPRLAQEQDVGASISQASLRPGDLAVWDGHVAMIIGNGMMVEAGGDPVELSPVRTTNAGQGFQGFWRPTA